MKIQRAWFEQLIFRGPAARRFTQDSPVLPDVWIRYAETYPLGGEPTDLILTPHRSATPAELAQAVRARLRASQTSAKSLQQAAVAYHLSGVVARLDFEELIRVVLPLSAWWHQTFDRNAQKLFARASRRTLAAALERLSSSNASENQTTRHGTLTPDLLWTIRIVGSILLARKSTKEGDVHEFRALTERHAQLVSAFAELIGPVLSAQAGAPLVWTVSRNRAVSLAISRSRQAVKADAAQRLFEIDTRNLAWAVLDTGIDAEHPAFRRRVSSSASPRRTTAHRGERQEADSEAAPQAADSARSRVLATFDFTYIRELLNPDAVSPRQMARAKVQVSSLAKRRRTTKKKATLRKTKAARSAAMEQDAREPEEQARELARRLQRGAAIDWDAIEPFLKVPHDENYQKPSSEHGTHVAGILAGNWTRTADEPGPPEPLVGMCPELNLYDFRVFGAEGLGDEFTLMAALQFIRHLNAQREQPMIHGVNLSLALAHDVANYACGRTPICDECDRVVNTGVVVVAAAGNEGYMRFTTPQGDAEGYRSISISDPGNAERVITVGATHRYQAHAYGVSYFSSRGPTGDGRQKPDLVAPGEKITAPVPNEGWDTKDGTSMAAPHVSGAAALLMARHRELMGRPERIKEILCSTATDLGRERYFQGSGMVDILRALQAV